MQGLTLTTDDTQRQLIATIDPLLLDGVLSAESLSESVKQSEYSSYYLLSTGIAAICEKTNAAKAEDNMEPVQVIIGEIRDANVMITISDDQMSATIEVEAPHSGSVPSIENCISLLNQQGVKRGISKKRIALLLQEATNAEPGKQFKQVIAKGLTARKGKNSFIKPLVPNALERVLQPQLDEDGKANMRDLGEILCVQPNQRIAQRISPTKGRKGFTVSGSILPSEPGEWKEIKLGNNTKISPKNENVVLANLTGMPKFSDQVMSVDDTFESKGVNVGTGNIHYEGAVVITGDVTESMQVVAKGDVTINGFVESATIRAGGDIIITEGAMGKMNEEDCKLYANGSIFVQHGQGLDIIAGKNVNIQKQLAYSRVKCRGSVTVGAIDNPMGNIFASEVNCYGTIRAGTIGAVSGSSLDVDFSEGLNILNERYEMLVGHLKTLRINNFDHQSKLRDIHKKDLPETLATQLTRADTEFDDEKKLLDWLEKSEQEMAKAIEDYQVNARIIAHKELFPGVSVKLNKQTWKSEREYPKCCVKLVDGKWGYDPLV